MQRPEDILMEALVENKNGNQPLAMDKLNALLSDHPDIPAAWSLRASILENLGHPFDAIMNYDKAVALLPESAVFYNNRGVSYLMMCRFDEAMADFKRAIERDPKVAEAHNNIGNLYRRTGRPKDAIQAYRDAIKAKHDYVDAHLGLSFSLLECGEFEEGWIEYEWRWKSSQLIPRGLDLKEWHGEPAPNKDAGLLLYAEQGFGDALQFMRYVPMARKLWDGKIYLEVKYPLTRLAQTMTGFDEILTTGNPLPNNLTHCCALMSIPAIMKTTVETIPNECPYVFSDKYRAGLWREKIKALPPGLLVGICWAGMNRPHNQIASTVDKARSMTLDQFVPLAKIKGISWVSLQLGAPATQVKTPPVGMTILDASDEMYDFYDTAALIDCLDLVIAVDTSVVHLAGALGKPVWMLSRFDGCWRWMGDREDSPWYPTLRQFRQKKLGEWGPVVEEVQRELRKLLAHHQTLKLAVA